MFLVCVCMVGGGSATLERAGELCCFCKHKPSIGMQHGVFARTTLYASYKFACLDTDYMGSTAFIAAYLTKPVGFCSVRTNSGSWKAAVQRPETAKLTSRSAKSGATPVTCSRFLASALLHCWVIESLTLWATNDRYKEKVGII